MTSRIIFRWSRLARFLEVVRKLSKQRIVLARFLERSKRQRALIDHILIERERERKKGEEEKDLEAISTSPFLSFHSSANRFPRVKIKLYIR